MTLRTSDITVRGRVKAKPGPRLKASAGGKLFRYFQIPVACLPDKPLPPDQRQNRRGYGPWMYVQVWLAEDAITVPIEVRGYYQITGKPRLRINPDTGIPQLQVWVYHATNVIRLDRDPRLEVLPDREAGMMRRAMDREPELPELDEEGGAGWA